MLWKERSVMDERLQFRPELRLDETSRRHRARGKIPLPVSLAIELLCKTTSD
jgi:hypothetical protein